MIVGFTLSEHASYQMQERNIQLSWIEDTLVNPQQTLPQADSQGNTHYLKQIPQFDNRWLRVIVNPTVEPNRIVTVFFDRRIK
jgi:hypothetical protein